MNRWFNLRSIRSWFIAAVAAIATFLGVSLFAEDNNLSWDAPTTNADGSPLTDLAGYKVYYGLNGAAKGEIADIADPAQVTFLHANQTDGLHCYEVTAYDLAGNESAPSNEACKFVDTLLPGSPLNLSVN